KHVSYLISETFKYSHIVLACVTYNLNIYPPMHNFLIDMKALNVQNRTFAVIENGSWAPTSGSLIREQLDNLKNVTIIDEDVSIATSMEKEDGEILDNLATSIIESMKK
ncbi:MAG: FprA family A-type flavoprotein, partial [Coprobacillaceae bacterium]